jgi:hypothetical protein
MPESTVRADPDKAASSRQAILVSKAKSAKVTVAVSGIGDELDKVGDNSDKLTGNMSIEERLNHYQTLNSDLISYNTVIEEELKSLKMVVTNSILSKYFVFYHMCAVKLNVSS